jgi:hypothetical protein
MATTTVVVPDDITFGPVAPEDFKPSKSSHTFGEVRAMADEDKYLALKRRLDHFLIGQVNAVCNVRNADCQPDNPQILALLSCVVIATLGKLFYESFHPNGNPDDGTEFMKASEAIDPALGGLWNMTDNFELANQPRFGNPLTHSRTLYKAFRCTFVHSYRTTGAFLDNGQISAWAINPAPYYLKLSPDYFWQLVREQGYKKIWKEVLENLSDSRRTSLTNYTSELLK